MLIDRGGYKEPPPWPRPQKRQQPQRQTRAVLIWRNLRRAIVIATQYVLVTAFVVAFVVLYTRPDWVNPVSKILTPVIKERGLPGNPLFSRPSAAPNGSPWPTRSDYIAGYQRLNVFGMASVTVDNSGGSADLFVKLIDRDQKPMKAVRIVFLKAHDKFELYRVTPGHYDVRYKNLDTGQIRKSQKFEVSLKKTSEGEQYMGWTVGLYDVINGTVYHETITEKNF
jgi:hypothetical protein